VRVLLTFLIINKIKYSFIKALTKCKINLGCDIKHDIKSYSQLGGLDDQAIPSHGLAYLFIINELNH
jgi:hypothetical protein